MLLLAALALAGPPDVDSPLKGTSKARKDAALVITVEDYKLLADVSYATRDGDSLQAWLSTTHGVERIERVQDPDRNTLRRKIDDAARAVRRGGTLWVYFAGHGTVDEDGRRTLLTREAAPDDPAGVGLNDLVADLADSRAKQVIVVLDAGFSGVGRLGEPLGFPARDEIPLVATPAQKNVSVWAAASGAELPGVYPDAGHGMFAYFFLGALRGWADGATGGKPNGDVTLEEAQSYVSETVKQVGGKLWNPSKESREDVIKWSLARSGQLEIGPDKELLAAMAQSEKARRVKEATDSMIAVANAEWLEIAVTTAVASPAGIEKLNAFIKKYELATVSVDGVATA
ncbi:MAG: caspase family protein, partial [Deltaproteobacteria bacterium]|nr:caspase family protein [Deltaproteobacteria bacterium]